MGLPYEVGDIVTLKKVHPCGSRDWEILRVGADFRLKCTGCGHQIMVPRKMVEKNTKNLIKKENNHFIKGGGHSYSAGLTAKGDYEEILRKILKEMKSFLEK